MILVKITWTNTAVGSAGMFEKIVSENATAYCPTSVGIHCDQNSTNGNHYLQFLANGNENFEEILMSP